MEEDQNSRCLDSQRPSANSDRIILSARTLERVLDSVTKEILPKNTLRKQLAYTKRKHKEAKRIEN